MLANFADNVESPSMLSHCGHHLHLLFFVLIMAMACAVVAHNGTEVGAAYVVANRTGVASFRPDRLMVLGASPSAAVRHCEGLHCHRLVTAASGDLKRIRRGVGGEEQPDSRIRPGWAWQAHSRDFLFIFYFLD